MTTPSFHGRRRAAWDLEHLWPTGMVATTAPPSLQGSVVRQADLTPSNQYILNVIKDRFHLHAAPDKDMDSARQSSPLKSTASSSDANTETSDGKTLVGLGYSPDPLSSHCSTIHSSTHEVNPGNLDPTPPQSPDLGDLAQELADVVIGVDCCCSSSIHSLDDPDAIAQFAHHSENT